MKTLLATTLALSLPALAAAHDYTLGDLEIIHPTIFETAATAKAGGGYVTIANTGESADALVGVSAAFPMVELHESFEQDGVMRMQHIERLDIGAGEIVELAPGGYHVMFMGLTEPFVAGDEVPVTLTFENAGEIEVNFTVVEREGGMDHGKMDHGNMDHSTKE
ncbi:MAG: copper chaperone PCu(A)C [Roseovarius sp.]|nr:copper chaperone PCu(A)C [Roseovarius sp.]